MNERVYCKISGTVQGVGFRYFVMRHAHTLGVVGWVRNSDGGSVEFCAEGPRSKLEQLVEFARNGPYGAHVRDMNAEWSKAEESFHSFDVRY